MERAFLAAARKLVLNHGFSTLITSYGPTPVLKVGLGLKRLHPEILWVADFRDEDAEPSLLDEALRAAELLSTVSSPIVRAMESRREQLGCLEGNGARILEVMNGYDFEEIRDPERPSGCFRIFFAGTFHSQSRPEVFFKALEELIAERGLAPSQIAVTILGGNAGISIPKSLRPMIHITDRVPYRELPRALEGASALLLVLTDHSRQGVYSGKIFDYLAVNRPIVALVNPDDVAAGLVRSCNAGFIGDSSSVEDSKRALTEAYDSWKAGRLPGRDWAKVTAFKRGLLISRLSEAIRNLSANGPA
jgi:glycosyltransferase involved in cell wall biosynthesis